MEKKQFYNEYKEVFNLDNIKWDMPKFGVKGYVKNLPFKVQVSLKNEINMDSLFYVIGGYIYHLDLAFLRPELDDKERFPDIKIGKLNAIEIDSKYLTKHELDIKSPFKFNTKTVETPQFPIMDKDVKPIDDYIDKKLEYDIVTTSVKVNVSKEDSLKLNEIRTFLEENPSIIGEINFPENNLIYSESGNVNNFPELETFEANDPDRDRIRYETGLPLFNNENITLNSKGNLFGTELIEHQSPEKFHSIKNPNFFKALNEVIKEKKGINMEDVTERFNECIDNRLEKCKELLLVKGVEYRRDNNPYHNFNVGSKFTGESSEKVLYGFLLKHLISLQDIINDINVGKLPSKEIIEAKVSDIINYMLILEALIEERRNNNE